MTRRPFLRRPLIAASLAVLSIASLVASCGQKAPPAASAAPQVSVAPVVQREVQEFDEFTARLETPDTVEVRARVAGALSAVHFREGQVVKKGDLLFTIDPRPFAAEVARLEAQLAAASTQAALSQSELARAEKLVQIQGVSQQEVEQLRANTRKAQSGIQAAEAALTQARLDLEFTRITARVNLRVIPTCWRAKRKSLARKAEPLSVSSRLIVTSPRRSPDEPHMQPIEASS